MTQNEYRKFLLSKIDVAQREIEIFKGLMSELTSQEEAEAPAPTKAEPKKAKPTKSVEEAVEEMSQEESDDLFSEEETENAEPEVTLADVRQAVKTFAAKHGKEKTLKFLQKFKVTAIPDLKKADYAKVIELAKKHT